MEKSPEDEVLGSQEEPTQAPVLTTQERVFRTEDSNEVTENLVMDLENGSELQNEEHRGQQEDMDAPVLDINGRAYADGTVASTTTVATESDSSKIDGGRSSSSDEKEEDIDLVEFHKGDRDQNGDTYPDPPKKRETAVEDVDPSRNFQNRQFEEKRDEPSSLQEEMLGKGLDQPEKVSETVPPTSRNETQALASREGKSDHDSQLEETEKHVEDGISQSNGTAKKTEEYVENGHGSSQVEIDGDDTDRYEKRDSDVVNLPLKEETENSKTVKAIDSIAGTERQIEADSQLEEGRGNGGNDMSQGDETLQKKEEIVENTSENPQGETGGDQIDQWQKTDLNTVNSSSKSESENHGVYKIVKAIEDLQVGPEYIHGEVDHGLGHQRKVERSDGFKGIVESVSEGTHGVASGFADSKSDRQKETGISRHRHDSTKSLEQLDVQEDPNTEASLEDGSQFQFHNNLMGVEKVSEVKPVERILDIEESKNDMQKETGISERHTSTKSLEQLYVQEEPNIEEPLKDGSQLQFHNNLTGVEEISEVKPVERNIDIDESKIDMQKETGIRHHRPTSTKSLELLDVQEEPIIAEPLEDGSQFQLYNNLTGVEDILEVKPVERNIEVEENVEARNGKVKEINTGVTTVVDRESRVGATTYTLSSTVETYRTSVVYSKKDGLLLQRESGSPQTPSALIENSDHADMNHPRLKIVHQFPRETKIGEEHPVGAHEASTSKPVEGESESELEKILRLQQTHDLLCPNCGSCITKRVVLRKRKRTTVVSVDKWEVLDQETSVQLAEHAEDEVPMEEYEETEDWGCLGCFTFLFRRGQIFYFQNYIVICIHLYSSSVILPATVLMAG